PSSATPPQASPPDVARQRGAPSTAECDKHSPERTRKLRVRSANSLPATREAGKASLKTQRSNEARRVPAASNVRAPETRRELRVRSANSLRATREAGKASLKTQRSNEGAASPPRATCERRRPGGSCG